MLIPVTFPDYCNLFLLFIAYSVLGWCGEMIYCSVPKGHICEKRGFLNGLLCPIYGHGALLVLYVLRGGLSNPILTFFAGAALTSALEYFTSWLMETLFHMRWWDYSRYRFQINGRVCLLNSTCFGIACVLLCHVVHPRLWDAILALGSNVTVPLASFLSGIYLADTVLSVRSAVQLGGRLEKLHALESEVRTYLSEQGEETRERIDAHLAETRERIRALRDGQDIFERRLLRSHPNLLSRRAEALDALRQHLNERIHKK